MNKRVSSGLIFTPLGAFSLLLGACGGPEQPPPAEPSGYQAPTAEEGTDQGIGNMSGDVESTEPTDNAEGPGMDAPMGTTGGLGPDQSGMGTGGTVGTGGTASGGSGGSGDSGGSGGSTSPGTGAGR